MKILFAAVHRSLLAQSGQSNRTRVCRLLDNNGQKPPGRWIDTQRLTPKRHWLCTAAMVLMPVSAPIEVLV